MDVWITINKWHLKTIEYSVESTIYQKLNLLENSARSLSTVDEFLALLFAHCFYYKYLFIINNLADQNLEITTGSQCKHAGILYYIIILFCYTNNVGFRGVG